jgi:sigma54-dependent transcription regulator
VDCGHGLALRCGSGEFAANADTAVSVRHHDVQLALSGPAGDSTNWASATVARQVYLGSHRDYLVTLAAGETVRAVTPVGVAEAIKVDVRVIAATNADLASRIAAGSFRQDLYFRLARYTVAAPPLRERLEDVPMLVSYF